MMRVLLDINVILDAMLRRPPWNTEADAILHAAAQGQVVCATTPLSLATIFYVSRKIVGTSAARIGIRKYLAAFEILSIDKQTLLDADLLPGSDFEDNILIAAAVTGLVDAIVTRNVGDFSHSPISVLTPVELLQRLATAGAPPVTGPP
jgi:predicted nucleic acid-binding protein